MPLSEIAEEAQVVLRANEYEREETAMLEVIRKYGRFLPEDLQDELYFVDTTSFLQPARLDKKLIGLVEPDAKGYVKLVATQLTVRW